MMYSGVVNTTFMPMVGGKKFAYTLRGFSDAAKMLRNLGQEREAKRLEQQKETMRKNKAIRNKKAPVRKALKELGYIPK